MRVGSLPRTVESVPTYGGDGYLLQSESDLSKAVTHAIERSVVLGASGAIAFASEAGGPAIPNAPGVRAVQRTQLEVALPWVIRTLGLPAASSSPGPSPSAPGPT